jgi:hypothetical protein
MPRWGPRVLAAALQISSSPIAYLLSLIFVFLAGTLSASAQQPMTMPSPTPKASPPPAPAMKMPGMDQPVPSPTPAASPQTQTNMPGMNMPSASPSPEQRSQPMPGDQMPGMAGMKMNMGRLLVMNGDQMGIRVGSSEANLSSMNAMGSGTSWLPSSSPMYMQHRVKGDWLLMFHYTVFIEVNHQGGPRGNTKFESANWFMPMAYHKLGPGTLQLRGMFSAEPFTFPPGGSPLLFQTGETYKGRPIIDRQHPHDLFMELSAQYTLPLGDRGTWFSYIGYPGEPALGPPAFMHRVSAGENPSATLAHHLQDSTHISFGVLTTGFTYRWFKIEGSIFNGREPDENRYDFDDHKWDSHSLRLSIAPNKNWTAQVSYGFLKSPENQEPNLDIDRTTASLQYNLPFNNGNWATALIWGRNHSHGPDGIHHANGYTLESSVNFIDKNYIFTRVELVDKDDLLRAIDLIQLGITQPHPSFRVGGYSFGGARDIWNANKISLALGGDFTFYSKPATLDPVYGRRPVSWKLFLRIRPARMTSNSQPSHDQMNRP